MITSYIKKTRNHKKQTEKDNNNKNNNKKTKQTNTNTGGKLWPHMIVMLSGILLLAVFI